MNRNCETAFSVIVLIIILSVAALGQGEAQPVDRSALTDVSLRRGAHHVNDAHVPAEIAQTLEKLVAQAEGKVRQGDLEVLLWTGSDLKKQVRMRSSAV